MALTTTVKQFINAALRPANFKIETLAAERAERRRLEDYTKLNDLDALLYPLSPGMAEFDHVAMAEDFARHHDALARLVDPERNDTGYAPGNNYFESPDLEPLYLIVRRYCPSTVVEIGCGNSTKITRQAIMDGKLSTKIVAVDPQPRTDIANLVDRFERRRIESLANADLSLDLRPNDILFIDSSHELRAGNDCAHLFCRIIPALPPGVLVHVHDIFLPYEYPPAFFFNYPSWGEQYLLHAMLQGGNFEIIWPGHYLQKSRPETHARLPFLRQGTAQSFWMRKR